MLRHFRPLFFLLLIAGISACSTQTVKSTSFTPIKSDSDGVVEEELLDIGIGIFQPGLDDIPRNREELTFSDVRMAETYFASYHLASALAK